jgi:putative endonuclease
MKQDNKLTGNKGEQVAAEHLQQAGATILARNWRAKWGEIDIVARIGEVVVFVEVKTKTGHLYGEPWEMINQWKVEQVKRMGELWCVEHNYRGRVRLDVVGVWLTESGDVERVEHWENVG